MTVLSEIARNVTASDGVWSYWSDGVSTGHDWGFMADEMKPNWRPEVRLKDLMTAQEVAKYMGWKNPSTGRTLWKRGTFPAPVINRPGIVLWHRQDILDWETTHHRRPGVRNKKNQS